MSVPAKTFFCGIGGSGMLPLALIAKARGSEVAGSDRSRDAGRSAEKFAFLERKGIALYPQDGSGLTSPEQTLVASAAIEDSVPEVAKARALGAPRMTRAELNAALFNDAAVAVGIGGTSGKSTVTAMLGHILSHAGLNPTVMNGAVMRNFATPDMPFASAVVGDADLYVSEVDESDGSIALYRPSVAVVTNISLDHKSLDELQLLFGAFLASAGHAIVNADDADSADLPATSRFGFAEHADVRAVVVRPRGDGIDFTLSANGETHPVALRQPGRHNVSNALAACAAANALGVSYADAARALTSFASTARRYEIVGTAGGVTVIDDFAHNPDKVAATLSAVADTPGRALIFFQPHGYGPLRQMGAELAKSFAAGMREGDRLWVCDPVYFGGTVDRSVGSERLVADIRAGGGDATHLPSREECGAALLSETREGDRILILGARDDTLTDFARSLFEGLAAR